MAVNSRKFLRALVNSQVKQANEKLDLLYSAQFDGVRLNDFVAASMKHYESLLMKKNADGDRFFSEIGENTHMTARQLTDRLKKIQQFNTSSRFNPQNIIKDAKHRAEVAGLTPGEFAQFWKLAREYDFDYIGDSETYVTLAQQVTTRFGVSALKQKLRESEKLARKAAKKAGISSSDLDEHLNKWQRDTIRRLSGVIE